jgi:hypothetical protein
MEPRALRVSAKGRRERSMQALAARYASSITLANEWLDSHRTTQEELASIVGADRTALNRYLNEHPDYKPCATRPQMMKILEGIERACASPYDIVELPPEELPARGEGWEDTALYNYHLKLNHALRRSAEPSAIPNEAGVIVSMAACGPARYRSRMCANAAVTLASALERVAPDAVSERALRGAADWLLRLEREGLGAIESCENALVRDRIINAVGCGVGQVGALVGDEKLIDAGGSRLVESSRRSKEEDDGFWTDTLAFVERLFTMESDHAERWSALAAKAAKSDPSPSLWSTLRTRSLTLVFNHWNSIAPDLLVTRERKDV